MIIKRYPESYGKPNAVRFKRVEQMTAKERIGVPFILPRAYRHESITLPDGSYVDPNFAYKKAGKLVITAYGYAQMATDRLVFPDEWLSRKQRNKSACIREFYNETGLLEVIGGTKDVVIELAVPLDKNTMAYYRNVTNYDAMEIAYMESIKTYKGECNICY